MDEWGSTTGLGSLIGDLAEEMRQEGILSDSLAALRVIPPQTSLDRIGQLLRTDLGN